MPKCACHGRSFKTQRGADSHVWRLRWASSRKPLVGMPCLACGKPLVQSRRPPTARYPLGQLEGVEKFKKRMFCGNRCRFAFKRDKKTHCPAGHPYAGKNLTLVNDGTERRCRACTRATHRRWLARKLKEQTRRA